MFPVEAGVAPVHLHTRAHKIQLHNTDYLGCYSLPISAKHEIDGLVLMAGRVGGELSIVILLTKKT